MDVRKQLKDRLRESLTQEPISFSNIEQNYRAQEFLLDGKDLSEEELFELIYQNQARCGEEMIRQRAESRKEAEVDGRPYDSFLDTPEKERAYYDEKARKSTVKAMEWLRSQKEKTHSRV